MSASSRGAAASEQARVDSWEWSPAHHSYDGRGRAGTSGRGPIGGSFGMAGAMRETIGLAGIELIVLDAVGTLIEARPSVADAYAAAALRQGAALDRAEVKARFLRHFGDDEVDDHRGHLATDEARERSRWRRIVSGVLPEVPDPSLAFAELWEHFGRPEAWRAFDDVGPALDRLGAAGMRLRVASNFDARLRGVLRGLPGLSRLADGAVISSEVGRRKPHPEFYRAAVEGLGLPPDRVLFVGDEPENDLHGPVRAGLRAVIIDREGRLPNDLPAWPSLAALAEQVVGSALAGEGQGGSSPPGCHG